MKLVEWKDENGYKHLSLIRDDDTNDMARHGITRDPPDLDKLDWGLIKRDLHNALVDRRLSSWRDVQRSKDGITSAVLSVLRRRLSTLYKMKEVEDSGSK